MISIISFLRNTENNFSELGWRDQRIKVRCKCKKCGYLLDLDLLLNPLGSMKPGSKNPCSGLKIDKDSLDKLMETAKGASREELEKLGILIDIGEWEEAQERLALRKFLLENLKISRERRQRRGEKYVVATELWVMGDSFRDVDLTSSEVKSMGVDDLRMIPGITMQKKVYGITKGRDTEELKGIKFLVIIDGSGSMMESGRSSLGTGFNHGKIGKALLIGREIYLLTKRLGFDYLLALFSDAGVRVDKKKFKEFWEDARERASYQIWNGGTRLLKGLEAFTDEEYKDSNVVIVSDMDLSDFVESHNKIVDICRLTNTFKVVLVEDVFQNQEETEQKIKDMFPESSNLKIMVLGMRQEQT